jgi:aspartyl/glutamyl-tRNA(Asn/Gln) amidotransferase, C subunit
MRFSPDDVTRLARLARIDIARIDDDDVCAKLDAIFALIDELQAIDTAGIEPMAHAQDITLPLRDDAVTEGDRHALYQALAPAVADGLYLVPRVIE